MTWEFARRTFKNGLPTDAPPEDAGRQSFTVAAIAAAPPVLGDEFDETESALLPPSATARFLNGEFAFGWVAMRLSNGDAAFPPSRVSWTATQRSFPSSTAPLSGS